MFYIKTSHTDCSRISVELPQFKLLSGLFSCGPDIDPVFWSSLCAFLCVCMRASTFALFVCTVLYISSCVEVIFEDPVPNQSVPQSPCVCVRVCLCACVHGYAHLYAYFCASFIACMHAYPCDLCVCSCMGDCSLEICLGSSVVFLRLNFLLPIDFWSRGESFGLDLFTNILLSDLSTTFFHWNSLVVSDISFPHGLDRTCAWCVCTTLCSRSWCTEVTIPSCLVSTERTSGEKQGERFQKEAREKKSKCLIISWM